MPDQVACDQCGHYAVACDDEYAAVKEELAAAQSRIAELETDAQRYRWIRNNGFCAFDGETDLTWRSPTHIDAVIDAARKADANPDGTERGKSTSAGKAEKQGKTAES